jgi:hypothetical protein
MTKFITSFLLLTLCISAFHLKAQTTALQINGNDCNGVPHDLFADLDAGKAVVVFFFMPNCGACPPPAFKVQTMVKNVLNNYPGKVTAYAMPYDNGTTCTVTSSWASSAGLTIYAPYDKGGAQVAHYGGFGMPTVVLLGGKSHQVLFSTLSFVTSDTTIMRNKILAVMNGADGINANENLSNSFNFYPNPANNKITFQIESEKYDAVEVHDLTGKLVAVLSSENRIDGSKLREYNTSTLPNGLYMVSVKTDGILSTKKLIIAH